MYAARTGRIGVPIGTPRPNETRTYLTTGLNLTEDQERNIYAGMPPDLALMPISCYSCLKMMYQTTIEEALEEGKSLKDVMDELGYQKICCRRTIMTAVPIVALQRRLQHEQQANQLFRGGLSQLSIEETGPPAGYMRSLDTTNYDFSNNGRVQLGGNLQILDQAPPGSTASSFCLSDLTAGQFGLVTEGAGEGDINPFEHYMQQVGQDDQDGDYGDDE